MKKSVWVIAAMVLVVSVATAHFWLELRREREQGEKLAARVATLEAAQKSAVANPQAAQPAALAPSAAVAAANPAVTPSEGTKPREAVGTQVMAGLAQAMQGSQGQELMRGLSSMMYPDLAEELDLTPEQAEQLLGLLARQQQELMPASMGMMMGGDATARQAQQRELVEKTRAHEAELAAMLGAKYPRWEQYQGTAEARQQVTQLRSALGATSNPLSEAQSQALQTAFAAERTRAQREERDWMASSAAVSSPNLMQDTVQRQMESQRRLVDTAAPYLNAAQLEHYRRQVDQQMALLRATMGLMGGSRP